MHSLDVCRSILTNYLTRQIRTCHTRVRNVYHKTLEPGNIAIPSLVGARFWRLPCMNTIVCEWLASVTGTNITFFEPQRLGGPNQSTSLTGFRSQLAQAFGGGLLNLVRRSASGAADISTSANLLLFSPQSGREPCHSLSDARTWEYRRWDGNCY
jgi:hypothetical protein